MSKVTLLVFISITMAYIHRENQEHFSCLQGILLTLRIKTHTLVSKQARVISRLLLCGLSDKWQPLGNGEDRKQNNYICLDPCGGLYSHVSGFVLTACKSANIIEVKLPICQHCMNFALSVQ